MRLLLRNANVVAVGGGPEGKRGPAMDEVLILPGHSVLVDDDGLIAAVLPVADMDAHVAALRAAGGSVEAEVDCAGRALLPGFVDAHTHAVFAGDRCHEMKMKLAGATYVDVHKAGGGINFTVRHTREASEAELQALLLPRLTRMLRGGTTTVEVKSEAATVDVISVQIPELVRQREAGLLAPTNIDVFCEKGFFDADMSRRILTAGKEAGLLINFHGDELTPMGSGELGGAIGARAISHLEHVSEAGMAAMASANVFAILLPTTAYVLRIAPPPARALIAAGVPVALGSDFNPNAHCLTMPFVLNLACVNMRMTMNEALVAATINSAAALGVGHLCGSIEVGKRADVILLECVCWEHVIYEMGDGPRIADVFKLGRSVKAMDL